MKYCTCKKFKHYPAVYHTKLNLPICKNCGCPRKGVLKKDLRSWKVLPRFTKTGRDRTIYGLPENYFKCKCPPDLRSGVGGFAHRVPIDCLTTKEEIAAERKRRKKRG